MVTQNFIGERLKNARIYRGMTLTNLATETGLSKQALSQYENGTIKPEVSNLFSLAKSLNFPVDYFSSESKYRVNTETTYFRSLMSTSKKDRLAQRARIEFIAQIYEALFDFISFPPLNLPTIDFAGSNEGYAYESENEVEELEAISQQVRECWKLGTGPIKDFRYTIEANGIVVTCTDSKADKIDAFSQRTLINGGEVFLIVISKNNQSLARARFDMAHELAHILLHPWSEDLESIPKEEFKARERQANIFASALLLPKDTFGFDVAHYPTNLEYYQHLKSKWNVSIQAMVYRTQQLEIITPSQYQYLMRQISKNGWREKEPGDQPYVMTSNLLQGAVELLLKENELSVDGFLNALKEKGIVLHSEEIEELLCLKKGTLKTKSTARPSLIQLKSQIK